MFASLGRIYSRFSLATGENSNEELCLSPYSLLAGARTRIPEALAAAMTYSVMNVNIQSAVS